MLEFPEDFFWGAAISSYQTEGNNLNSDWWEWEKRIGQKEKSGLACRHYELFREDFDLARTLNLNCLRLSIEWSRIEPQRDEFSQEELRHYQDVISALRTRNLEPIVSLHHFTNPLWVAQLGGWLNKDCIEYFLRFSKFVVEGLSPYVRYWVTINEPLVYTYHSYILGVWPPQEKSFLKAKIVEDNLAIAHIKAYRLIHDIYSKLNLPSVYVSIAQNIQAFQPCGLSLRNKLFAHLRDRFYNFRLIDRLTRQASLDYIGINYYTRGLVDVSGWKIKNFLFCDCNKNHSRLKKNSLGWDIYPQGLYNLLIRLKKYKLPLFILENGICTEDDSLRWEFIYEHLENVLLAISKGVKILGYLYWSLIDNFEWDKGFTPRFGLIEVDYQTYKRTIRESAKRYAQVCKTDVLSPRYGIYQ